MAPGDADNMPKVRRKDADPDDAREEPALSRFDRGSAKPSATEMSGLT